MLPTAFFRVTLLPGHSVNRSMRVSTADLEENEIKGGLTTGDFDSWMMNEQRRVYLLCLRILRNSDEADMAAQDVFVKAYRTLQRSGEEGIREPAKWLTRVAVNTCIDSLNSGSWKFWRRRVSGEDEQLLLQMMPAGGANQEETLIRREKLKNLYQSLCKLSTNQKLVFVMRHDEGRTLNEIAGILGLDEGTVKAHMARAVHKLREELRDLYAR
jgi:RNA polymerase sigma-70 factor, ECF subfamily